jgi:hypothetical protein
MFASEAKTAEVVSAALPNPVADVEHKVSEATSEAARTGEPTSSYY